jgi:hypothetical protein
VDALVERLEGEQHRVNELQPIPILFGCQLFHGF